MGVVAIYGIGRSLTSADAPPLGFLNEDYVRPLKQLMPKGKLWEIPSGSVIDDVLRAASYSFARLARRAKDLVREADPRTAREKITDWEDVLGITPDADATLADRQDAAHAQLIARGGTYPQFYLDILAALSYDDAALSYFPQPATCVSPCTASLYDYHWRYAWVITATSQGLIKDAILQDQIARYNQLHTEVRFDLLAGNMDFEQGGVWWEASATGTWAIEEDPANARAGDWCLKLTGTASGDSRRENEIYVPCAPGDQFNASGYFKGGSAGSMAASIVWYDSAKAELSVTQGSFQASGSSSYQQSTNVAATAPASTAYARVCCYYSGIAASGTWYADDITFERA